MTSRELTDAIEVISERLYWVSLHIQPKNTQKLDYFSIDNDLVYEPFFADFGPLNLSMLYRYCKLLEGKLADPALADKRIIHYVSHDPKKRANAACLICGYQVIVLHKTAEQAYERFNGMYPPFLPFRDATCGICMYQCTIMDCLVGLEKAIQYRWFDYRRFDVDSCEFFEKVENGDMNWVMPDKFLAFAGPCPTPTDLDGFPAFTPEDYVPTFREAGVGVVVRLNKKQYDRKRFIDHGIKHVDLYFLDGSCPSRDIISKFIHVAESEQSAVAVHCKAGLGRTGTLIGLYIMKHFQMPARAFIGWNRICRPGSILGPQQQFLCDMQTEMFQAGASLKRPGPALITDAERNLAQQVANMSLQDRPLSQNEQLEDVGQGDRLTQAKRQGALSRDAPDNNSNLHARLASAATGGSLGGFSGGAYQPPGRPPVGGSKEPLGRGAKAMGIPQRSLKGMFARGPNGSKESAQQK